MTRWDRALACPISLAGTLGWCVTPPKCARQVARADHSTHTALSCKHHTAFPSLLQTMVRCTDSKRQGHCSRPQPNSRATYSTAESNTLEPPLSLVSSAVSAMPDKPPLTCWSRSCTRRNSKVNKHTVQLPGIKCNNCALQQALLYPADCSQKNKDPPATTRCAQPITLQVHILCKFWLLTVRQVYMPLSRTIKVSLATNQQTTPNTKETINALTLQASSANIRRTLSCTGAHMQP